MRKKPLLYSGRNSESVLISSGNSVPIPSPIRRRNKANMYLLVTKPIENASTEIKARRKITVCRLVNVLVMKPVTRWPNAVPT